MTKLVRVYLMKQKTELPLEFWQLGHRDRATKTGLMCCGHVACAAGVFAVDRSVAVSIGRIRPAAVVIAALATQPAGTNISSIDRLIMPPGCVSDEP